VKKRTNLNHLRDYKQWRDEFEASRTQHRNEFWEIQTEVENDWINSYNKALIKKFNKRSTSNRDAVIRIANRTVELAEERAEKQRQQESARKAKADEYSKTLLRKQELVEIMNIESEKWITLENYKDKITESLIIPENLDHSSYYSQLRELSVIAGFGKIVPEGNDFNNKEETQYKNTLIVPIFANVRSAIKKLSYSPLQPLFEDFEAAKSRLYNYPEKISEITKVYQSISLSWKAKERKDPKIYLTRLQEQTNLLVNLITEWNHYINVTKYDDQELRLAFSHLIRDDYKNGLSEGSEEEENEAGLSKAESKNDFEEANPETSDALDMALDNNKEQEIPEEEKFPGNEGSSSSSSSEFLDSEEEVAAKEEEKEDLRIDAKKVIDGIGQDSDLFSDFDMYKGIQGEGKPEDLKFVERIVNEAVKEGNKVDEEELEYEEDKDKVLDLEQYVFTPTYAVLGMKIRVEEIPEDGLDSEAKDSRYMILQNLDKLMNIRVEEAHMLVKVYKYHRYDPPVFK